MTSYCLDISRQFGKSFIMTLVAVEICLRKPKQTVVFLGPLKSQVNEIVNGATFATIFATCPPDLLPKHKDSAIKFPNGSRIRLAGSDNRNYLSLRGGRANAIFIDEAGFVNDLTTGVIPSVEPMTKTTRGKVIFASTPPEKLDHDYYEVLRDHEERNLVSTYTIHDDKSVTSAALEAIIAKCRGAHTTTFKREYECKRIAEKSLQVLPELDKETAVRILIDFEPDPYYHYWVKYVVADWGGRDKTAILFAHYNSHTKQVIVEDHLDLVGEDISAKPIAAAVKKKVAALWPNHKDIRYYCDNNNVILQTTMCNEYGIPFIPTTKGKLDNMVHKVRDFIFSDRLRFAQPAEFALKSMMSAFWKGDEFGKSKTFGHFDHTAAGVYLIRNVDEVINPVPQLLNFDKYTQFNSPTIAQHQQVAQSLGSIFKRN